MESVFSQGWGIVAAGVVWFNPNCVSGHHTERVNYFLPKNSRAVVKLELKNGNYEITLLLV